jgi:hypothetical protein
MADFMFDPYNLSNEQEVIVQSFDSLTYDDEGDIVWVIGRPDPVVVTGVRRLAKGTLSLVTLDAVDRDWLEALLETGRIVGFKPTPESGLPSTMYLYVSRVTQKRVVRRVGAQERIWTLEVQAVEAPVVA